MKQLDPVVESDLRSIESALAAGRPTAEDPDARELQELALLLESDAPAPDPAFAAALGDGVRDGFPRERRRRLPRVRLTRLHAASGIAAAALLVGVVVVSMDGDGGTSDFPDGSQVSGVDEGRETGKQAPATVFPERRRSSGAGGEANLRLLAPEPPLGRRDFRPGRRERRIERSATVTLAAPGDELERVGERIVTVTDRYGGFVLSSQVTSGDDGAEGGSFELRIPADRLQPALRDLGSLAEVRSRSQSGNDVTPAFVTTGDRLEAAEAERRSLLRRLENAETDEEAEALRRRLDLNAAEIRGYQGRLRGLRLRTNYARVNVTLVEDGDEGGAGGGSSKIDDAVDDALDSLVGSLGLALRVLGVAVPLGLLAAGAWGGASVLRRRRREAALS
jgi:hypothetical protein